MYSARPTHAENMYIFLNNETAGKCEEQAERDGECVCVYVGSW